MSESGADTPEMVQEAKLPIRDWVTLPLLGLLTIGILLGLWAAVAGRLYRTSDSTVLGCLVIDDPSTGVRAVPDSVCSQKIYESQLIEYRFNRCGHRAGMECGPKPPDAYRIVMVGSSFNFGMWVPREQSFAALLPEDLSRRTGRKVQLYNEAMQWGFPDSTALRFHQVFASQPDMIFWPLTPTDLANVSLVIPYVPGAAPPPQAAAGPKGMDRVKAAFAGNSIPQAVSQLWDHAVATYWNPKLDELRGSPSGILLQHLVYTSRSLYVKSYLIGPDSGYLNVELSADWQASLRQFDRDAAIVEGQARAAGVPIVVVLLPERAQAAMLSAGQWPVGYDPYKLDRELRTIVESHGGTYIDVLHDFSELPSPETDYFPVDGHPDARGHAMISGMLARALTGGAVPGLRAASAPPAAGGPSR